MRVRTTDGVELQVGDDENERVELVALHSSVVTSALYGTPMARAAVIADSITDVQFAKLFGTWKGPSGRNTGRFVMARRLRSIGRAVRDPIVRAKLTEAKVGWRVLVQVAKYRDPEAQLAAYTRWVVSQSCRR